MIRNLHESLLWDPVSSSTPRLQNPPRVAFMKPRNLRDLLIRAKFGNRESSPKGTQKCSNMSCNACVVDGCIGTSVTFKSKHVPGKTFYVSGSYSCKTPNVVYLVTCDRCGEVGVGETAQPLKDRIRSYKANIIRGRVEDLGPMCDIERHFLLPDHSFGDFKIMVLHAVRKLPPGHPDSHNIRKALEWEWQRRLKVQIQRRRARNPYSFRHARPLGRADPDSPNSALPSQGQACL